MVTPCIHLGREGRVAVGGKVEPRTGVGGRAVPPSRAYLLPDVFSVGKLSYSYLEIFFYKQLNILFAVIISIHSNQSKYTNPGRFP